MPQLQDRLHDRGVAHVGAQPAHEGLVDLEPVEREPLDVAQRRVAGAEVVHRQHHAHRAQPLQRHHRVVGVLHQDVLRQLQLQQPRRQPGLCQGAHHQVEDVLAAELHRRQVDAEADRPEPALLPRRRLPARLAQHPLADHQDQPGLLGQRDEAARRHQPVPATRPAQQRLRAHDPPGGKLHLRLVVQQQLAARHAVAQVGLRLHRVARPGAHLLGEEAPGVAPRRLGAVHREVGVAQQVVLVGAVARVDGHADGGADRHLLALAHQRRAHRSDHPSGQDLCVLRAAHAGLQDRELVAAEPRHRVAGLHQAGEALARGDEYLVAEMVAERVVDRLEAVEVDEVQRERAVAPTPPRQRLAQPLSQQRPVRQVGQRVVVREMAEPLLCRLALGDVERGGQHADHLRARPAQRGARGQERPALPRRVDQGLLARGQGGAALEHQRVERQAGLGVAAAEQRAEVAPLCVVARHAEEARQPLVDEQARAVARGGADQRRHRVDDLGQRLAAVAGQRVMRLARAPQLVLQRLGARLDDALLAPQLEQVAGAGDELVVVHRREQEVGGPGLQRLHAERVVAVGGHHDHRDVAVRRPLAQPPGEGRAVHLRHLEVGDDQVRGVLREPVQRRGRAVEAQDPDVGLQRGGKPRVDLPVGQAVVDDQDRHHGGQALSADACACACRATIALPG